MHELICKATKMSCVIMGDFNHHIDWSKREGKDNTDESFLDCMDECFLTQHVIEPTRGDNILDLVISMDERMIEEVKVGEELGTSDHRIIRFSVNGEHEKEVEAYQKRYNYFKADYDLVRSKIRGKRLTSRLAGLDPNEQWKQFVSCMKEVVEETIPLARRTNKRRPWVNNMVHKARRTKNKAWKRMQQLGLINNGKAMQLEQAKEKYIKKRNAAKEINNKGI